MSIIERDYLPTPKKVAFPTDLALRIVRKATALSEEFEDKALSQLKRDAEKALAAGVDPSVIIREMNL